MRAPELYATVRLEEGGTGSGRDADWLLSCTTTFTCSRLEGVALDFDRLVLTAARVVRDPAPLLHALA